MQKGIAEFALSLPAKKKKGQIIVTDTDVQIHTQNMFLGFIPSGPAYDLTLPLLYVMKAGIKVSCIVPSVVIGLFLFFSSFLILSTSVLIAVIIFGLSAFFLINAIQAKVTILYGDREYIIKAPIKEYDNLDQIQGVILDEICRQYNRAFFPEIFTPRSEKSK